MEEVAGGGVGLDPGEAVEVAGDGALADVEGAGDGTSGPAAASEGVDALESGEEGAVGVPGGAAVGVEGSQYGLV